MTHIMRIGEMPENDVKEKLEINPVDFNNLPLDGKYDIPEIDYDNPNNDGFYKLRDFLKDSGLMPKTKMQREGANFGKWDLMIGYIDDYRQAYILFYWWADRFSEYNDNYLIFLNDGIANTSKYRFEKNQKVLAELDKIVGVFGKSKEWKDK